MNRVLNMTGRDLRFYNENATVLTSIEAHGKVWVRTRYREVGEVLIDPVMAEAVPLVESADEQVIGLPDPRPDQLVIVSGLVLGISERDDLVAPAQMLRLGGAALGPRSLMRLR